MTGAATSAADPRRPWFLPPQGLPPGILSYSWLPSDDGRFALVELTARHRSAFSSFTSAIAADPRPGLHAFEPHRHSRAQVEAALQLLRRDFTLDHFRGLAR